MIEGIEIIYTHLNQYLTNNKISRQIKTGYKKRGWKIEKLNIRLNICKKIYI